MHGSTAKKLFGAITQGSISRVTREVKIIIKGNNSEIYNPIQQDIFNSYRNSLGQTFFLAAVEAQELEIIKHLANCQLVNFDDKDSNSETALHIAARKNNFQIAKYLIGKHIDIEATNKLGLSAFHIAVEAGAKEVVELFLSREIKNLDFVDLSHISEQCQFNLEDLEIEGNLVRAGSDEVRLIIKIIWLIDGLFVKMSENNHRKIFSWEFIEYQSNEDKLYIIDIFKQRIDYVLNNLSCREEDTYQLISNIEKLRELPNWLMKDLHDRLAQHELASRVLDLQILNSSPYKQENSVELAEELNFNHGPSSDDSFLGFNSPLSHQDNHTELTGQLEPSGDYSELI